MPQLSYHLQHEWLLTNGLGGYALGYGQFLNKRKYNGLLIAATQTLARHHLVAGIEEFVESDGHGDYLDTNHYPSTLYPAGFQHIVATALRPHPVALMAPHTVHPDLRILKEIFMPRGANAVVIKYSNLSTINCILTLRPKLSLRDHHSLNGAGTWDSDLLTCSIDKRSFIATRSDSQLSVWGSLSSGTITDDRIIYRNTYYPVEAIRGYPATEDLIAPVKLVATLDAGDVLYLTLSETPIRDVKKLNSRAEQRYRLLPHPIHDAIRRHACDIGKIEPTIIYPKKDYLTILHQMANDFVVNDNDIIAGYPWFGAWGRDTMIALGGVIHLKNGQTIASDILHRYGALLNEGRLPNIIGEGGVGTNFDSVDAPLWFALRALQLAPKDNDLFDDASSVVLHYMTDSHHPFYMDHDGFISIRPGPYALTWMDAKINGEPVTPRWGKPVEINALWYNVLILLLAAAKKRRRTRIGDGTLSRSIHDIEMLVDKLQRGFGRFEGNDFLADRLDEHDEPVWEERPNAIIALSLPYVTVSDEKLHHYWTIAKDHLATPYGLRSLSLHDPMFKQKYVGNQKQRDMTYHQGTVWGFLMGPWIAMTWKALSPILKRESVCREIESAVWALRNDIATGTVASVAEIWDGLDPHDPRGCPAQAWSVMALLDIETRLATKDYWQ